MLARLRARLGLRRASGQTMVILAIVLPVLVLALAVVAEGANAFVEKQHLQNAADAASLAASQDIVLGSSSCSTCAATAATYSALNSGPNAIPACSATFKPPEPSCVQYPYISDASGTTQPTQVMVQLNACYPTFFGGIVGKSNICMSARSVASAQPLTSTTTTPGTVMPGSTSYQTTVTLTTTGGSGGNAFADSTACPAITYTGAGGGGPIGGLETNGGVLINGNANKTINNLAVGTENTCYNNQPPATVNNLSGPFAPIPWPVPIPAIPTAPGGCTSLGSASLAFTVTGNPPGIYCLTGTTSILSLGGLNLSAGYTFFAPCIHVNSNGGSFTNYPPSPSSAPPTLFFASGTPANCAANSGDSILIDGQSAQVNGGDMFAPNGQIALAGGGISAGSGFLESQTLNISGNSASYTGTGPIIGGTTVTNTTTTGTTIYPGTTSPSLTNTSTTGTNEALSG